MRLTSQLSSTRPPPASDSRPWGGSAGAKPAPSTGPRPSTPSTARAQVRDAWGEPPRTVEALPDWANRRPKQRAEADPRVIDAAQHVEAAQAERERCGERHKQERLALLVSEYGAEQARRAQFGMHVTNPRRQASRCPHPSRRVPRRGRRDSRTLPIKRGRPTHRNEAHRAREPAAAAARKAGGAAPRPVRARFPPQAGRTVRSPLRGYEALHTETSR